jgi:hypothetical protein
MLSAVFSWFGAREGNKTVSPETDKVAILVYIYLNELFT